MALSMGGTLIVAGIYLIYNYIYLMKHGIRVKGTLMWIKNGPFPMSLPRLHAHFDTDKGKVTAPIWFAPSSPRCGRKEGETISVVYNPNKNTEFLVKGLESRLTMGILLSFTGFMDLGVYIYHNVLPYIGGLK